MKYEYKSSKINIIELIINVIFFYFDDVDYDKGVTKEDYGVGFYQKRDVVYRQHTKGEAGRSRPCRFWGVVDGGGLVYGSPRKEKRIWSWRGERRFWAGR